MTLMIAAEENQLLTQTDRGHALRRIDAALLAAGGVERRAACRRRAAESENSRRRAGVVPRRSGAAGFDRPALRASRHRLELRPRRGWRAALPLSWLALRYLRPGDRSAGRAGRRRKQGGDSPSGLSLPGSRRNDFRLHGTGRAAAVTQLRVSHRRAGVSHGGQGDVRVQLSAGQRRQHRSGAPVVPASNFR